MKRFFLTSVLVLLTLCTAAAQQIVFGPQLPDEAAKLLEPRLVAMLKAGGVPDAPLSVDAVVTDRMETSGSIAQTALTIELTLQSGEVRDSFVLTGVGADEADAWNRAVKQFLPRSQAARAFVEKLRPDNKHV